jgi:hypothetical protein
MLNVHYAIYCDRCYRQFDEERLLEQHKQREAECDIQPPRQLEGLNKEECVVILRKMNTRRAADRTWAWAFGMAWPEYPTNRYPTERTSSCLLVAASCFVKIMVGVSGIILTCLNI